MALLFATGKLYRQVFSLPAANDMWIEPAEYGGMIKQQPPVRATPVRTTIPPGEILFLREWLLALGLKQGHVAAQAEISPAYVSQLVNREKYPDEQPKIATVMRLALAMDMPWQLLFELPPRGSIPVSSLSKYPPSLQQRLAAIAGKRLA